MFLFAVFHTESFIEKKRYSCGYNWPLDSFASPHFSKLKFFSLPGFAFLMVDCHHFGHYSVVYCSADC